MYMLATTVGGLWSVMIPTLVPWNIGFLEMTIRCWDSCREVGIVMRVVASLVGSTGWAVPVCQRLKQWMFCITGLTQTPQQRETTNATQISRTSLSVMHHLLSHPTKINNEDN